MKRVIPADYETTFNVVIDHLDAVGYPVTSSQYSSGVVVTGYYSDPSPAAKEAGLSVGRLIVYIHRRDETHTEVVLNFNKYTGLQGRTIFDETVVAATAQALYQDFFEAIEAKAIRNYSPTG